MFLSNAAIRRPVAMSCLIIGLTLLGLNSWREMGLELMPETDLPFVTIQTEYPGASPSEIETDIAKKIEDSAGTIDGLKHISSSCMENVCLTFLEFELGVDVDIAATDVREKLDLVRDELPADAKDPIIQKFDVNAVPIITLGLTGDAPLDELYDYADNDFRDRVSIIKGVADVEIIGGAEREVQVKLDRDALASHGLTSMDVVERIRSSVKLIPVGRIKEGETEYSIKFDADYPEIKRIENLQIAGSEGRRCKIGDVGRVAMSTDEVRQSALVDGESGLAIRIVKKSDANAVKVATEVREEFEQMRAALPGGMELLWITDNATFIRATNASAWLNVFEAVLLTAAILFFFLYNLRALLVVAISMPLTIVIGLFFMRLNGMTLNTSTLIAIGLSVGILVTNSIVVLEGIVRRLEKGKSPRDAAQVGARDTFIAVLASAGTNMVVLFPLVMMGTLIGEFIRPLALTMFIMTAVSLFLSFSLTPMLCSILLRPADEKKEGTLARMEKRWNKGLSSVVSVYRRILQFNERHRWSAALLLLVVVGMFFGALRAGGKAGFTMVNEPDRGELYVKLEFPTRTNLDTTEERVKAVLDRLDDLPELRHSMVMVGKVEGVVGQSSEGVHLAQVLLVFSQRTERSETIDEIIRMARDEADLTPGAISTVSIPSAMGGQSTPVEMQIRGPDLKTLDRLALQIEKEAEKAGIFKDADTTVRKGKPQLRIVPRRPIMADLNIAPVGMGMNLRANVEGLESGTFRKGDRSYDIVVKLADKRGKKQMERLALPGAKGRALALPAITGISETTAPVQITREDKQRASKFLSQLAPDVALGKALERLSRIARNKVGMPPGYSFRFAGQGEMLGEAVAEFGEAALTGIVLVFLLLSALLESFKQSPLVMVTLPLGLIGMLWALALAGASLDIFAMMGAIMLIGIVVNNAILIMDQFNVHIAEGVPPHKAMITAATERFRPIAMITIAAVLGMLPLALAKGIGGEMRNNVGIACVGGILVSGIFTLFVIPVLYDVFTRRKRKSGQGD